LQKLWTNAAKARFSPLMSLSEIQDTFRLRKGHSLNAEILFAEDGERFEKLDAPEDDGM